jgi:hypothetical protein
MVRPISVPALLLSRPSKPGYETSYDSAKLSHAEARQVSSYARYLHEIDQNMTRQLDPSAAPALLGMG